MAVFLYLYESAFLFQVLDYLLSCLIAVHACICGIVVNDGGVVVHYVDNGQVMTETYLEVVGVVSRSYLNNTCTEVHLNIIIGNNGYLTVNDRQDNCLADEVCVALVLGVYSNSCIAEESLGTSGSKLQITVGVLDLIAEVPEMACLILVSNLSIGK